MNIRILYFARLREALGLDREILVLDAAQPTLADLLEALRARGGAWCEELGQGRNFRMAVNQDVAGPETGLHEQDEVAIFPPVTGG